MTILDFIAYWITFTFSNKQNEEKKMANQSSNAQAHASPNVLDNMCKALLILSIVST